MRGEIARAEGGGIDHERNRERERGKRIQPERRVGGCQPRRQSLSDRTQFPCSQLQQADSVLQVRGRFHPRRLPHVRFARGRDVDGMNPFFDRSSLPPLFLCGGLVTPGERRATSARIGFELWNV